MYCKCSTETSCILRCCPSVPSLCRYLPHHTPSIPLSQLFLPISISDPEFFSTFTVQCLVNILRNKMIFRGFSLVNISFVMTFAIFMMKITLSEWAFFTFICHLFNLSFAATFSISFIMFILLISRCGSHCQNEPSRHPSSTFCRCSSAFSRPDIFMLSDHISSPTHLISHISPVSFPRNQSIPRQTFTIKNFAMGGERLEVERSKKKLPKMLFCCFNFWAISSRFGFFL